MRASARPRQPLGGLVAVAPPPPPRGSRLLPGLGGVRKPEGGPCECERPRAPAPRRAPGLCASWSFFGGGGGVSRAGASECPVLAGERVCVLTLPSPAPRSGPRLSFPPLASLPGADGPNPNHLCTGETQLLLRAPGGGRDKAIPQRGHRCLLPPRLLPLSRLTLPPWEGCLEGSGRPKPKPRSASYDQLGVCLLLPRAQVWEQASVQNMSEGGDGQGRGVGEDHHQRGRHAT